MLKINIIQYITNCRESCQHIPWTPEEKGFILEGISREYKKRKNDRGVKKRCEEAILKGAQKGLLKKRTWVTIKGCVKNLIVKNKKTLHTSNYKQNM